MSHDLLQARIIHISDTHFGPGHRFQGRVTPDGSTTSRIGIPSLGDSILADLDGPAFTGKEWRQQLSPYPLLVAITGDLTQGGQEDELAEAERFIRAFDGRAVLDTRLALSDVAFVPGNHDLIWDAPTPVQRWALYCEFDRRLRGSATSAGESRALTRVTCRPERRMIVAEINSAFYVEKGKIGTFRGEVDDATLSKLRRELEEITDRFGKLPAQGQTLFDTHRLRVLAKPYGVAKIDAGPKLMNLVFRPNPPIDPMAVISLVQKNRHVKLAGNDKLRIEREIPEAAQRAAFMRDLLRSLGRPLAAAAA